MKRLSELRDAGVSVWLDTLSRDLLQSGRFEQLVEDFGVSGATSNPTIFAKAITGSSLYDDQLKSLPPGEGHGHLQEAFFATALDDVREAARVLRPVYDETGGRDGFVSFECTPDLADDADATVRQALYLWKRLDLPNVLIKVPATVAGVAAIEELTAAGVNVNVTLLFSVRRYDEVIEAYLRGLERRVEAGEAIDRIQSVASFFVSRVDAKADAVLPSDSPLRGQVAVANAQVAYARYLSRFAGPRWEALETAGAKPQRPLWASTGTKNAAYSDVLYVESLIAPDVINTMPDETLRAFAEHGRTAQTLTGELDGPEEVLAAAASEGADLEAITRDLEREGVEAFCDSYQGLLRCLESKLAAVNPGAYSGPPPKPTSLPSASR